MELNSTKQSIRKSAYVFVLGAVVGLAQAFAAPIPQSSCTFTNPANTAGGFVCNLYPSTPAGGINDVNTIPFPAGWNTATDPITAGYVVILLPGLDPNNPVVTANPANYRQVVYFIDDGLGSATGITLYTRGCNNPANANDVSCFPSFATINSKPNFFDAAGAGQPPAPYIYDPGDNKHLYNVFFVPVASPTLSKAFGEVSIGVNGTTSLTFTLANADPFFAITGVSFTDALPAGLVVSTPNALTSTCGGTTTAVAGSGSISLTAGTVPGGGTCTIRVNVTGNGSALGLLTNTTSTVTSLEAAAGTAATARIFVGDPFEVSYAANLAVGDSYVDITNVGTLGAALQSGTTASTTGAICANVFAFTPDEQLVSCCSCPVTPGGLVALSAKNDLASNTLTPAVPTALVIKIIATVPVAGSCNNSAAAVTTATLASGLKAFDTTLHATPVAGSYGITETPFSPSTLSSGELTRVGNLCNFILANGSGFGVCRSCRLGALGAERQ